MGDNIWNDDPIWKDRELWKAIGVVSLIATAAGVVSALLTHWLIG